MKKVFIPLIMVALLALIPYVAVTYANMSYLFGVIIPYAAAFIFVVGFLWRLFDWLRRPVPFPIVTTCGQEKSLDWVKQNHLESPSTRFGAAVRVLSEVLFFRSLFRNTKAELHTGPELVYASSKWLWMGGLAFHWSLLIIGLRHARFFFIEPPAFIAALEHADSFLELTLPAFFMTDAIVLVALTFLVARRIRDAKLRIISLQTDFFPLFLIGGIVLAGMGMRYLEKVDILSIKALMMGLVSFSFDAPGEIGALFFVHLFLVSMLAIYFPFSKLMHMGAIFLSPTRNLPNNSREKLHKNPWNKPGKFRTYAEYEEEFREKMKKAGLPVEKD